MNRINSSDAKVQRKMLKTGEVRMSELHLLLLAHILEIQTWCRWQKTTTKERVPAIFQEFGILSGYRLIGKNWRYYLASAFQMHNETLNVWTHVIGLFFILRSAKEAFEIPQIHEMDGAVLSIVVFSFILVHLGSICAHLLHNRSEHVHCTLFYVDNVFAAFCAFGVILSHMCYTSRTELYSWINPFVLPMMFAGACGVTFSQSLALAICRRKYCTSTKVAMFSPPMIFYVVGCVPHIYKVVRWLYLDETQEWQCHYIYATMIFLVAAVCFAFNLPERWLPGYFDIIGHSHQWWHIFFTLSCCHILEGLKSDIINDSDLLLSRKTSTFSVETLWWTVTLFFTSQVFFIIFLQKRYKYDTKWKNS